jgi:hypothetical protein
MNDGDFGPPLYGYEDYKERKKNGELISLNAKERWSDVVGYC